MGCPWLSKFAHACPTSPQKLFISSQPALYGLPGQPHCTLNGVSPQPSAVRPVLSLTPILARAQITSVIISAPNLSGTRALTGRKYKVDPTTRMSVDLTIENLTPWAA